MFRLNECVSKQWLRAAGCPVPRGSEAESPEEAARIAADLGADTVVKALIPTGRRGKAGAVLVARSPKEAEDATGKLLGAFVNGYAVQKVLVEEKVDISRELFLSFMITGRNPELLLSAKGGVDIEEMVRSSPAGLVRAEITPVRGISSWFAIDRWIRAGISGDILPALARLTCTLYDAFVRGDALVLELNPIAITGAGELCVVGCITGIDENALYRHKNWVEKGGEEALPANEREKRVALINRQVPGGECQYVELDGDIGLLVGGGGAGLYQHDLMLRMGGAPANHSVTPPTGADNRKLKAVLEAIFDNPKTSGLLIGFNFTQMSRTDIRVRTLVEVLDEKRIDTSRCPIVIRLFGAGEDQSRAMVAGRPNVHYMPRGTSLKDAVRLVVDLVARQKQGCAA